jgi:hypothetical protein
VNADALEKTEWCRKTATRTPGGNYKALLHKLRLLDFYKQHGNRTIELRVEETFSR